MMFGVTSTWHALWSRSMNMETLDINEKMHIPTELAVERSFRRVYELIVSSLAVFV